MLGELVDLDLEGIDWLVVGGESGHNEATFELDWVSDEIIETRWNDVCSLAAVQQADLFVLRGGHIVEIPGELQKVDAQQ